MKRAIESLLYIVVFVGIIAAMARVSGGEQTVREGDHQPALYRKWETTMTLDGGDQVSLFIAMHHDDLGRTVVTCDVPELGIEGMKSSDAVFVDGRLAFRNEMGRFEGRDMGTFMVLALGELVDGRTKPEQQFFCDVVEGSQP